MGRRFATLQFPGGKTKAFTLSYDDGVIQDRRLAELFRKYGAKATFNLNSGLLGLDRRGGYPGKPDLDISTLAPEELKTVYAGHEIAGHGLYHCGLNTVGGPLGVYEIAEDKRRLEAYVGRPLRMFAYPFGKWGRALAAKHKAFPPTMKFTMLNCLPISVGCSTIVGCVVSFIKTAQAHAKIPPQAAPPLLAMWLPSWLKLLPLSILVSYVLAVLISPFVVQAVGLGGPPAGAGPGGPPAGGPPRN